MKIKGAFIRAICTDTDMPISQHIAPRIYHSLIRYLVWMEKKRGKLRRKEFTVEDAAQLFEEEEEGEMTQQIERPIIFSGEMVRAILEGRKTQTRRVVKLSMFANCVHDWEDNQFEFGVEYGDGSGDSTEILTCPYGKTGDLLWVREAWQFVEMSGVGEDAGWSEWIKKWDGKSHPPSHVFVSYKSDYDHGEIKFRSSIYMPRWASRITLQIKNIRVERVQDISEEDAIAEGVGSLTIEGNLNPHRQGYRMLWNTINGNKYPWSENPWVWVIDFEVTK